MQAFQAGGKNKTDHTEQAGQADLTETPCQKHQQFDGCWTLTDITMNTLSVSFLLDKCLFATYDSIRNLFVIRSSHGIGKSTSVIETADRCWKRVFRGRTALALENDDLTKYFGSDVKEKFGEITGALIVPMYLDRAEIELLGVIIAFSFFDSLISDEENVLTLETIAGHVAPILYNLNVIEEQKCCSCLIMRSCFKKDLKQK